MRLKTSQRLRMSLRPRKSLKKKPKTSLKRTIQVMMILAPTKAAAMKKNKNFPPRGLDSNRQGVER